MDVRDTVDADAKETEWRVERVVWVVLLGILGLAAAGLFGGGALSDRTSRVEEAGATYILRHEAYERRDHVNTFAIEVRAPAAEGDTLHVVFPPSLVEGLTIRSTAPPADETSLGPDGATYTFQVSDWSAPLVMSVEYLATALWQTDAAISVQAGEAAPVQVPFRQFVYP